MPDIQREFAIELAADHFVGDLLDQLTLPGRKAASLAIDHRRGFLDIAIRVVNLFGHLVMTDVEMNQAALGLRTPVVIGGHFNFSDAVEFLAKTRSGKSDRQVQDFGYRFGCHRLS